MLEGTCKNMCHCAVSDWALGTDREKLFTYNDGTVHSNSFSDVLLEKYEVLLYENRAMMLQCDTF